jgi:hypothetical protein
MPKTVPGFVSGCGKILDKCGVGRRAAEALPTALAIINSGM